MIKVLFVCLGNICRSPTADGIFVEKVKAANLQNRIEVDSAGTGDWHIGRAPDKRAQAAALKRGYDLSNLRARQVSAADFEVYDYILAMDNANLNDLRAMKPANYQGQLALFLNYGDGDEDEVPDPYYGGDAGFDHVLDLVEAAADGLLKDIQSKL